MARKSDGKTRRKTVPKLYVIPPGAFVLNDLPAGRTVGGNTNDKQQDYDRK